MAVVSIRLGGLRYNIIVVLQIDFKVFHGIDGLSHCSKYIAKNYGSPSPPLWVGESIGSTGIFHIKYSHLLVRVSLHIRGND